MVLGESINSGIFLRDEPVLYPWGRDANRSPDLIFGPEELILKVRGLWGLLNGK